MELKWLEDFICLANTGSFSKAADSRHVTQSAFSRRIMALEEWLGTTLIDRKSHPIKLTDEGARFVETAQQSVRMFHKVRNDFNTQNSNKRRTLAFGIADHLAIHFFPKWAHSFENGFPSYYFSLFSSIKSGASYFESLRFQEYDFLICYSDNVSSLTLDTKSFASLTLGQEALVPVGATSLLEEEGYHLPGTPDKPIPNISYKPHSILSKAIAEITTAGHVAPIYLDTIMESSSAESIKRLTLEGYGMSWLPESAIDNELNEGALKVIGDHRHYIPLTIEIHRYVPNTKPEIMDFWEKLSKNQSN